MAKFFIDRPIFAWVVAIVLMMIGVLGIAQLPVSQYPSIAPPSIGIAVTYPGASAETVQDTVVQVIEQQMNGLDHLEYMDSQSNADGSMTITLTFAQGTDPDIAQVQVQNKLSLAEPLLPQEVQNQGIRVTKATKNFLMVLGFVNTEGTMTREDIGDYVASYIQDPVSRTLGVGDFTLFGSSYAMRIWLDPAKLLSYGLTAEDVTNAISNQNVQISSGELGGLPAVKGQELDATIIGPSRLQTPEEFRNILLTVTSSGAQVRLRDVATVELGSQIYSIDTQYDGLPATGLAIKLATGANALDTDAAVRATIARLQPFFPPGLKVVYPYDTTPFVQLSIHDVVKTLIEAIVLVFLVMYLFLQNLRATLIPTLAVPVVLLGAFGILNFLGYSINTLTMFGMVLAIGLLVDDAIVVVENVERVMVEDNLGPKEATRRSMGQITGALIGIATVLAAVFVPMALFGGSTGVIYRQFSVTIVSSMVLSVIVAIVFTPALCATLLKPASVSHHEKRGFFGWFNRHFDRGQNAYASGVSRILGRTKRLMLIYVLLVAAMAFMFLKVPSSFLPTEDQGIVFTQIGLPPGATAGRTQQIIDAVTKYYTQNRKDVVDSVFSVRGFNFAGRGQNAALVFVRLKDWGLRTGAGTSAQSIADTANGYFYTHLRDAQVYAVLPPAVVELGNVGGFDLELMNNGGLSHADFLVARNKFLAAATKDPKLSTVRPNGIEDAPQYELSIDREKAMALGVAVSDIDNNLATIWGSSYVNDFIDRGRVKKVYVQGEAAGRMLPNDLNKWYVKNSAGTMVPFSAFATAKWTYGPQQLSRHNGVNAYEIQGNPGAGLSSGEAMAEVEHLASQLPVGVGYQWTGLSYEEVSAGAQTPMLYTISLIVVFLCLAALYESWSIPFAVMLVVPLGIIGALAATLLRGLSNDVYFQVGLLTTVGLAAKNAILIVEFAREHFEAGASLTEAAVHAARQRLRPILMTSMAFILGVLPLAISNGAGAASQHAIGTGVIGGMLTATVLAIFFVPTFFVVMLKLFRVKRLTDRKTEEDRKEQERLASQASNKEGAQE